MRDQFKGDEDTIISNAPRYLRKKEKMQNQVLHLILRKPVSARRKLCKNQKINGKELKAPEEMTYWMA